MSDVSRESGDVTRLLAEIAGGDPLAGRALFELVYRDLRAQARSLFVASRAVRTLQATALVHEAWLKLGNDVACRDRTHFFALAAKAMRQVVSDHVRGQRAAKRGGGNPPVTLHEGDELIGTAFDVVALDDCLTELSRLHPRHAQVVELRVFGGLTIAETGHALGVSHGTVESDWNMARAWLRTRLGRP